MTHENLLKPGPYVTHLESAIDGTRLDARAMQTLHEGRPLWVRYALERIRTDVRRDDLSSRPATMWRYRELLPVPEGAMPISLGEGMTPLLPCPRLGKQVGLESLWVKDESQLPTGSFKSRGMAMAITMASQFGIKRIAVPSAGNAGGAAAAYGARAGMEVFVFVPEDTPVINQYEAKLAGAHTFLVNGLITDCGRIVREGQAAMHWFDLSTLKEPYRLEGKKTMGLELAEQCQWKLPDVILYPTGGGTGLIGMWKGFQELLSLGWLNSERMPRMVSVQSDGCCPIVRAFESGERFAKPFPDAQSVARGIRVPAAVGDFMMLDVIRESQGTAIAVDENRLPEWLSLGTSLEGISFCPETAACIGACQELVKSGWIKSHERVVIFNTGAGQKYVEAIQSQLPRLDIKSSQIIDSVRDFVSSRKSY